MDYNDLQKVAQQVVQEAERLNILSKIYWYSPESRKLKTLSKIGYYETKPSKIRFTHGCKLIVVFPRSAFNQLEPIMTRHLAEGVKIAYREDYKCQDDIGFDVYQRLEEIKLFIEPDSVSSERLTNEAMLKRGKYWAEYQRKALEAIVPSLTSHQMNQKMDEVKVSFKKALLYLQAKTDQQATLRVRRYSGVKHQMTRVNVLGDQTKKVGFSGLVLAFGSGFKLPNVVLPKEANPNRKRRADSIAAQYEANPAEFKYYDKFGIFEVCDK